MSKLQSPPNQCPRDGRTRTILAVALLGVAMTPAAWAQEAPPRSHDPRLSVTLFAENPQIVTPTGIDVDAQGRVWAVESNTHFPPEGYQGHLTDRIWVFKDADGDHRGEQAVLFTDGLRHTMSVAVKPRWLDRPDGFVSRANVVYLATRKEIILAIDQDGDLKCDEKRVLVHLDTPGDYPHDALAGFAFDALGWMYFGCGENLGANYKLIGSDGTTLSGGGEGGNVYRCRPDGSKLTLWSTGYWNPHASCIDAFGRLFTVDNDPDSRPPCRLMHVVRGSDFGYRYRNGRKGLHPFSSWNGEIAGTLPMVAGTGEAPSGVIAYESDGLPAEYRGNLFATSWGDHRIDRFRLSESGVSVTSVAEPLVTGGENFRPVGLAVGPDGSLYFTDWVLRDYKLHSRGRIWKIHPAQAPEETANRPARQPRRTNQVEAESLLSPVRDERRLAALQLAASDRGRALLMSKLKEPKLPARARLEALWALARVPLAEATLNLPQLPDSIEPGFGVEEVVAEALRLRGEPHFQQTDAALLGRLPTEQFPLTPASPLGRTTWFARLIREHADQQPIDSETLLALAQTNDPFLISGIVQHLREAEIASDGLTALFVAQQHAGNQTLEQTAAPFRVAILLAGRAKDPQGTGIVKLALNDNSQIVRRAAAQWAAEEKLAEFRGPVLALLDDENLSADLFLATIAALEMFDGVNPQEFDKTPAGKYVLPIVKDEKRPAGVRALALRLVPANEPALTPALLEQLLAQRQPQLSLEVVRSLQDSQQPEAARILSAIAVNQEQPLRLRAEAVVGLGNTLPTPGEAAPADGDKLRETLLELTRDRQPALQFEALRSLRGKLLKAESNALPLLSESLRDILAAASPRSPETQELIDLWVFAATDSHTRLAEPIGPLQSSRPSSRDEWLAALGKTSAPADYSGDANAGRRVFFHPRGATCARCHTVDGRGGKIGPDLSTIGRSLSREKLADSILEPSREVAPQFVAWTMLTDAGKSYSGTLVFENEGKTSLGLADGQTVELPTLSIIERVPQTKSLMPEKLSDRLTVREFLDLLAYLESLR